MNKPFGNLSQKQPGTSKKTGTSAIDGTLHHLAFDNSILANIITTPANGKIIIVNKAACKLLGYSKKELLTKNRTDIFDIKEDSYKRMLKQRTAEGHSIATVTTIRKNGKLLPCEITCTVFMDGDGFEKAVYTIADMSQHIQKQKNIDTEKEKVVAGNIVLAKSKQKKIDTKKEKIVADNIVLAKSEQKEIDVKKEKTIADNIVLAKSKQKNIDIKKEKLVADNIMLAQEKADDRLAENNEWIKYIAKTSYDVMWDWDIISGEIYVGDSMEEVFGYKVKNNTAYFADFSGCLLPEKRDAIEKKIFKVLASGSKNWDDSFMFKRKDGSVAAVTSRASVVRDEEGKAIRLIGAIHDISLQKKLEEKLDFEIATKGKLLTAYKESFKLIFNSSADILYDVDLVTDKVIVSDAYEKEFGYKITSHMTPAECWANHIHPDDKAAVLKDYRRVIMSDETEWKYSYRFLRADNSAANVISNRIILRDAGGKPYRILGSMHDISKQKVLEERLAQEIKLKEKQIAEATEDAKDNERSTIGKELHDNVNQLLAVSKLYVDLAKRGGENSEMYLSRSSEYTLSAIDEIRKLTKELTTNTIKNLGLAEAINHVVRDIMEINPVKIFCSLEGFIENSVNDKFKLNVFRIVQEQLNNILKHARATEVTIALSHKNGFVILTISDNGVGFDTTENRKGIGMDNIESRAAAYKGTAIFVSQPGDGCQLTVTIPVTDMLLNKF